MGLSVAEILCRLVMDRLGYLNQINSFLHKLLSVEIFIIPTDKYARQDNRGLVSVQFLWYAGKI